MPYLLKNKKIKTSALIKDSIAVSSSLLRLTPNEISI